MKKLLSVLLALAPAFLLAFQDILLIECNENTDKELCYSLAKEQADDDLFIKYLKMSAEKGYHKAQNDLGVFYGIGYLLPQNKDSSLYWIEVSAMNGNALAQNTLGCFYKDGFDLLVEIDYEKAFHWYRLSALQGEDDAQYNLACMHRDGQGTKQDYLSSYFWFKKAAKQDYMEAQFEVGIMNRFGVGTEENAENAAYWYVKAADNNHPQACNNIAAMYMKGEGVETNGDEYFKYTTKGASFGNSDALAKLAASYLNDMYHPHNDRVTSFAYLNMSKTVYGDVEGFLYEDQWKYLFESINEKSIQSVHKKQNKISKYEELIKMLHDRDIMINASLVFGFDDDEKDVFQNSLNWLIKNKIETMTSHILTPYPGTKLYDSLESECRIIDRDLTKYNTSNVVFKPMNMTAQELKDGYLQMYKDFYSIKNIIKRTPTKLSKLKPYLLFNLGYRKFGKVTAFFGKLGCMDKIGILSRKLSYGIG